MRLAALCPFIIFCFMIHLSIGYQSSSNRMKNVFVAVNDTDHLFIWGDDMTIDTVIPGITHTASSLHAVAIIADEQLYAWGSAADGGLLPAVPPRVVSITSTEFAFAAVTTDARVFAWGSATSGGTLGAVDNSNVVQITSTSRAFAALTSTGRVFTWGHASYGGDSSAVSTQLQSDIIAIYANHGAFAALTSFWELITWGDSANGGNSTLVQAVFDGRAVDTIVATRTAFCAVFADGTIVPWGNEDSGGKFTVSVIQPRLSATSVQLIASTVAAFAVTTVAGDIIAWGDISRGGAFDATDKDVVQLASNSGAFAAVLSDGSVLGWGGAEFGAVIPPAIAAHQIQYIIGNSRAFAAITTDEEVYTYGSVEFGGGEEYDDEEVVSVVVNDAAFLILDDHSELNVIGFNNSHGSGTAFPAKLDDSSIRNIQGSDTYGNSARSQVSSATETPTTTPTLFATVTPTYFPTFYPTTIFPSSLPTSTPTAGPTSQPSFLPTSSPTSQPTSLPSSWPTSSPTCRHRYKHEDGSSDCVCKAGTHVVYNHSNGDEICRRCDIGTYSQHTHNNDCDECEWPSYNYLKGSTECNSLCLCFSSKTLFYSLVPFVALFLCCVWAADGSRYAVFVILFFPTLDVFSDVLYIATTTFYSDFMFYAAVFFVLLPTAFFVQELVHLKASPQILWWPVPSRIMRKPTFVKDFWWLGCQGSSPTFYGERVSLIFQHHDGLPHLLAFILTWLLLLAAQISSALIMILWPIAGCALLTLWFLLGLFLHLTKVSSIGKVRTLWYFVWTCSHKHRNYADVDLGVLNRGLFSEFVLETLPQLGIQAYNNEKTHIWTLIAQFSAVLSLFIAVNGSYRFLYWTLYAGRPIEEIELGVVVRILGAKPMTRKNLHKQITEKQLASKRNLLPSQSSDSDADTLSLTISPTAQLGMVLKSDGTDVHPVKSLVRMASQSSRAMSARMNSIRSIRNMSQRGSFLRYKATSVHPFEPQTTERAISMSVRPIESRKRPANLIPYILALEEQHEAEEETLEKWRTTIWNTLQNENNYINTGDCAAVMQEYSLEVPADLRFLTITEVSAIAKLLKPILRRKLLYYWTGKLDAECIGNTIPDVTTKELDQVLPYLSEDIIDGETKL